MKRKYVSRMNDLSDEQLRIRIRMMNKFILDAGKKQAVYSEEVLPVLMTIRHNLQSAQRARDLDDPS